MPVKDEKILMANHARIAYFNAGKLYILRNNLSFRAIVPNPTDGEKIAGYTKLIADSVNEILEILGYNKHDTDSNGIPVFKPLPWPPFSNSLTIHNFVILRFLINSNSALYSGEFLKAISDNYGGLTDPQTKDVREYGVAIYDAAKELVKYIDDGGGTTPGNDPKPNPNPTEAP
jgi:hypothetical protein